MSPKISEVLTYFAVILTLAKVTWAFRGEFSRASTFSTVENHILVADSVTTRQTYDILSCAQACLSVTPCKSFNFGGVPHGLCELYNLTKESRGLVYMHGSVYGELQNVTVLEWPEEPTLPSEPIPVGVYTFTTLGAVGKDGPSETLGYTGTPLEGKVVLSAGIQKWLVPRTSTYVIEAYGASGGNGTCNSGVGCNIGAWKLGGLGARIKGTFSLVKDQKIQILVGQKGQHTVSFQTRAGSGGGGTFVVNKSDGSPLLVAGGGGGGGQSMAGFTDGDPGQASTNGSRCGGSGGQGGRLCTADLVIVSSGVMGGAGAGLNGNGKAGAMADAMSFTNGGAGSPGMDVTCNGGFGGGGFGLASPGGGGGYSGGGIVGTATSGTAGGGGSFNSGTSQENTPGVNNGDGKVVIKEF